MWSPAVECTCAGYYNCSPILSEYIKNGNCFTENTRRKKSNDHKISRQNATVATKIRQGMAIVQHKRFYATESAGLEKTPRKIDLFFFFTELDKSLGYTPLYNHTGTS